MKRPPALVAPTLTPRNRRERRASRRLNAAHATAEAARREVELRCPDAFRAFRDVEQAIANLGAGLRVTFGPGAVVFGDVYRFTARGPS